MRIKNNKKANILTKMVMIIIIVISIITIISLLFVIRKNNQEDIIKDKKVIRIWGLYGDVGNTLIRVTDQYTKTNPDVIFEVSLFKNETYKSTLREAIITNDAPDIFYAWGDEFLKEFVDLGAVRNINEICDERNIYNYIKEGSLQSFTINDDIYGIPLFGWKLMLFANKEIFKENNVKIPENYEEFVQAIKSFKEAGIVPLAVGAKESWTLSLYYMMLALKNVDIDNVKEALHDNKKFDDYGFLKAAEEFKELRDIDAFSNNILNFESYNSDFYFSDRKSAMTLNGTWLIPQIKMNFESEDEVEAIDISKLIGKKEGIGGFVDGFIINSNSDSQDIIDNIYIDIFKKVSDIYIKETNGGIPIWNDEKIDYQDSLLLYEIVNNFQNYNYHGAYDVELPYKSSKNHLKSIELLFNGEISPREFIDRHIAK